MLLKPKEISFEFLKSKTYELIPLDYNNTAYESGFTDFVEDLYSWLGIYYMHTENPIFAVKWDDTFKHIFDNLDSTKWYDNKVEQDLYDLGAMIACEKALMILDLAYSEEGAA